MYLVNSFSVYKIGTVVDTKNIGKLFIVMFDARNDEETKG